MAQVGIIIPLMRPHRIAPVVQSIQESTTDYHIIVLATGECAEACKDLPITLIDDGGGTFPQRINRGYRASQEPFITTGADDVAFLSGWFEAAMRTMATLPNGSGVVGINDCYNAIGNHFVIARDYVETLGGVMDEPGVTMCEEYQHQYCDDDLRATAIFHGRWAMSMESRIEHLHVGAGKSEMDAVYAAGEATSAQGRAVFMSRAHLWANKET